VAASGACSIAVVGVGWSLTNTLVATRKSRNDVRFLWFNANQTNAAIVFFFEFGDKSIWSSNEMPRSIGHAGDGDDVGDEKCSYSVGTITRFE
jgi:hypothetical protein